MLSPLKDASGFHDLSDASGSSKLGPLAPGCPLKGHTGLAITFVLQVRSLKLREVK